MPERTPLTISQQVGIIATFCSFVLAFDWLMNIRMRGLVADEIENAIEENYARTWGKSKARHDNTHELLRSLHSELRELRLEVTKTR